MRAERNQREWFNISLQNSFHGFDTRYSSLYKEVISPSCPHYWKFTGSRSSGNLLRSGEIGCGAFPYALRFDGYYTRLKILGSVKAAALLKSLPLQPVVEQERQDKILRALDELDDSSQNQANNWWNRYKHLFTPQKQQSKTS